MSESGVLNDSPEGGIMNINLIEDGREPTTITITLYYFLALLYKYYSTKWLDTLNSGPHHNECDFDFKIQNTVFLCIDWASTSISAIRDNVKGRIVH